MHDVEANFIVLSLRDSHLPCAEGGRERPGRLGNFHTNSVASKTELVTPSLCREDTRRCPGQSGWRSDAHSPRGQERVSNLKSSRKQTAKKPILHLSRSSGQLALCVSVSSGQAPLLGQSGCRSDAHSPRGREVAGMSSQRQSTVYHKSVQLSPLGNFWIRRSQAFFGTRQSASLTNFCTLLLGVACSRWQCRRVCASLERREAIWEAPMRGAWRPTGLQGV